MVGCDRRPPGGLLLGPRRGPWQRRCCRHVQDGEHAGAQGALEEPDVIPLRGDDGVLRASGRRRQSSAEGVALLLLGCASGDFGVVTRMTLKAGAHGRGHDLEG